MTDHRHRTYLWGVVQLVIAGLLAVLLGTLIHSLDKPERMIQVPASTPTPEARADV